MDEENVVTENGYFDKTLQVRFTLKELLEIHKLLSNEMDNVDIYKSNELMKTVKAIEKKTSKYIAWV